MEQNKPELWQAALIAGSLAAVLSSLPLVNCCCCLWPIAGGLLAVFLHQRQIRVPLTGGDGADDGAVLRAFLLIPLQRLNLQFMQKYFFPYLMELFDQSGQQPPSQLEELIQGELPALTLPAFFLDLLLAAALFAGLGALGGVIAVSLFKKKTTPPLPEESHGPQDPGHRQP